MARTLTHYRPEILAVIDRLEGDFTHKLGNPGAAITRDPLYPSFQAARDVVRHSDSAAEIERSVKDLVARCATRGVHPNERLHGCEHPPLVERLLSGGGAR